MEFAKRTPVLWALSILSRGYGTNGQLLIAKLPLSLPMGVITFGSAKSLVFSLAPGYECSPTFCAFSFILCAFHGRPHVNATLAISD
jgi:hypothetical protein